MFPTIVGRYDKEGRFVSTIADKGQYETAIALGKGRVAIVERYGRDKAKARKRHAWWVAWMKEAPIAEIKRAIKKARRN